MWVEKYRPKTLSELSFQSEIVRMLQHVVRTGNMPHLLFYGPPGTGKTSAILALAKELFGFNEYKSRVLELNASDEIGIDVIREKIKNWSKQIATNKCNNKNVPYWKIVILDEAEMMTTDAQSALRRIMEVSAKNTRFVIICNYLSKIIDPLSSRCAKYRFHQISVDANKERLEFICKSEQIGFNQGAIDSLIEISNGDLRRAITILQSASSIVPKDSILTQDHIFKIIGNPDPMVTKNILTSCIQGSFEDMYQVVTKVIKSGWDVGSILNQITIDISNSSSVNDYQKAFILLKLSEADVQLVDNSNEFTLLLNLCNQIQEVNRNTNY